MAQRYKMVAYNALQLALGRDGIQHSGKVATLLLQTFIGGGGKITAAEVEKVGLCGPSQFKVWRKDLVDKGWLGYDFARKDNFSLHTMGKKLIEYVNRENLGNRILITSEDLERRLKLERTRERAISFKIAINKYDPPFTDEKFNALIAEVDKVEKEVISLEKELFE